MYYQIIGFVVLYVIFIFVTKNFLDDFPSSLERGDDINMAVACFWPILFVKAILVLLFCLIRSLCEGLWYAITDWDYS